MSNRENTPHSERQTLIGTASFLHLTRRRLKG